MVTIGKPPIDINLCHFYLIICLQQSTREQFQSSRPIQQDPLIANGFACQQHQQCIGPISSRLEPSEPKFIGNIWQSSPKCGQVHGIE